MRLIVTAEDAPDRTKSLPEMPPITTVPNPPAPIRKWLASKIVPAVEALSPAQAVDVNPLFNAMNPPCASWMPDNRPPPMLRGRVAIPVAPAHP